MKQYRKKPVVIEAVKITEKTFSLVPNPEHLTGVIYDPVNKRVFIDTPEGTMQGNLGDYIIKGVKGELYPCKADIFEMTYDRI